MKTFNFNTGVKNPEVLMKGHVLSSNGVMLIPFSCEDVPDNAQFAFAGNDPTIAGNLIVSEMHNTAMSSKFAFFRV